MLKKDLFDYLSDEGRRAINTHYPFFNDYNDDDELDVLSFCDCEGDTIIYNCDNESFYDYDFTLIDVVECNDCNKLFYKNNAIYVEDCDYYICEDCKNDGDYFICEDCGNCYSYDNEIYIDSGYGYSICRDCFDGGNYFYCVDCGQYYRGDGVLLHNGDRVCNSCYTDSYFTCNDCGEVFHNDYACYCEDDDCYYCEDCIDRHENALIMSYHAFNRNDYTLLKCDDIEGDGDDNIYFGAEFENEGDIDDAEYVNEELGDIIHMERDGSLNNGFEMITHPMTYNFILKNRDRFNNLFNTLINRGHRAHDTSTCGLHIHINKKAFNSNESIRRFIALIDYDGFYSNYEVFNRRGGNHYVYFNHLKKAFTREDITYTDSHYNVVNVRNNDIEVRMFKGTLRFDTFIAYCQFLKNAINFSNSDRKKLYFSELMKGDFIDDYLLQYDRINKINFNVYIDYSSWNINELKRSLCERKTIKDNYINVMNAIRNYNNNNAMAITMGGF